MPPIPFWARPRFVFLAIFAYLAAHFAIRFALGPALSVDDAEQALFSQRYAWTYSYRSPSLATWTLVTLGQLMPIGVVAIGMMRYLFLTITYVFGYLTARRLIADQRLAALALYSFAGIHIFAESSHRNLDHSISLAAMLALSWYAFVRLAAAPRLGRYVLLGVSFGFGLLAKWNFAILALALPLACLLYAEGRRLILSWKTLPAIGLTLLMPLPAFIAQLRITPPPDQDIQSALAATGGPSLTAAWTGTLSLLNTALIYLMPLLPIAALVLGFPFLRGFRARLTSAHADVERHGAFAVGPTLVIALVALWVIVLAAGATQLKVRYMLPVLFIMPVWLFMTVEAGRPSSRAVNLFALVMAVLVAQVAGARILQPFGLVDCGLCMEWRPYKALAMKLELAGYGGSGTIVTDGETGGNMRILFPRARVVDPNYPLSTWPAPSGRGGCLLLSRSAGGAEPGRIPAMPYLAESLHGDPDAPHVDGEVSAEMLPPAKGEFSLAYRLYKDPNGDCR